MYTTVHVNREGSFRFCLDEGWGRGAEGGFRALPWSSAFLQAQSAGTSLPGLTCTLCKDQKNYQYHLEVYLKYMTLYSYLDTQSM